MSRWPRLTSLAAGIAVVLGGTGAAAAFRADGFDHAEHAKVFVSCQTCHFAGGDFSAEAWPRPEGCASCHDGTLEKRVDWRPPAGPPPTNLRFSHTKHADEVRAGAGRDSSLACAACHAERGADWMNVRRAVVENCLSCHRTPGSHFAVADTACATCHVPLWEAPQLAKGRIAEWAAPPSHREADFAASGHGDLAKAGGGVAASCATCHARDYCITCHVNAPEQTAIQALQPDPRSLAMRVRKLEAPASHGSRDFLQRHGSAVDAAGGGRCSVCHTQESCTACHLAPPGSVRAIPAAAPGRGVGARLERRRPASHGVDFADAHAAPASAATQTCAGCHTREQCLDCHRPNAAAGGAYHPRDFLTRHPVAAYGQEVSCGSCHNTSQFCQTCHQQSGVVSSAPLGRKADFHDAKQFFVAGHGEAARQSLESCASCHAERDCLTCHAALGARRFNPHGPGFDAERLRKRNSQMCGACHGAAIPSP
jgi:hypothetical protein